MVAAMQDQAARAARLRALREAAQLDTPHQDAEPEAAGNAEPVLKFRNYVVKDDKISHEQTAAANPPDYEAPTAGPDLDAEGEVGAAHHPNFDNIWTQIRYFSCICRNCFYM